LLSRPVMIGYMTGLALVMIAGQLGKITGAPVSGEGFVEQVRTFTASANHARWSTVAVAASVLVLLLILTRIAPRVPGPLIAVLAATAVVAAFSLHTSGIGVVGQIPAGMPKPGLPAVSRAHARTLGRAPASWGESAAADGRL